MQRHVGENYGTKVPYMGKIYTFYWGRTTKEHHLLVSHPICYILFRTFYHATSQHPFWFQWEMIPSPVHICTSHTSTICFNVWWRMTTSLVDSVSFSCSQYTECPGWATPIPVLCLLWAKTLTYCAAIPLYHIRPGMWQHRAFMIDSIRSFPHEL